jgi:hypothetical protein
MPTLAGGEIVSIIEFSSSHSEEHWINGWTSSLVDMDEEHWINGWTSSLVNMDEEYRTSRSFRNNRSAFAAGCGARLP